MLSSSAIAAIVIAVSAAVAFAGGFAVESWRSGKEILRLNSNNAILVKANDECATDIKTVQQAMTAMTALSAERERQAVDAMEQAKPQVEKHTARIIKIKALPEVAIDQQCEAIKQEQLDYIRERRKQ